MRILGLTGGIGMGKSTAARALGRAGLPVFDADRVVHRLQAPGGRAVAPIARLVPAAERHGGIDRAALRAAVVADAGLMRRLEAILHPMVCDERRRFLARARRRGCSWAVLDVPLLFETGLDRACDLVVVVSAPRAIQLHRVRARRGMSEAEAMHLIARQMPDREKRRRADLVLQSGLSRWHGTRQVRRLLCRLGASPRL